MPRCLCVQDGLGPKTAREIAARLNVGEHTIGKLLQSGLEKLRHPQRAGFLERYAEARAL
jgi:DNA-binding CsgD family transcriptional regulator